MKNSSGRVRVAKKKLGSGRVAGTRQTLEMSSSGVSLTRDISPGDCRSKKNQALKIQTIFAAGTTISSTRASEVNNVRVGAPQNLLAELNKNLQFQLAQNSNE